MEPQNYVQKKIFVDGNAISGKNLTSFSIVRYGNVLSSRGSIIPLIQKLKKKTSNLPLTDERMTRFFINLEDAVKFVLSSFKIMDKGEIFIPKMPSVYIKDLMKTIYPKGKIYVTGIRPGEKIDELLISKDESAQSVETKNSYIIFPNNTFVHSKLIKKMNKKKSYKTFEYNSKDNKDFLNIQKLKTF